MSEIVFASGATSPVESYSSSAGSGVFEVLVTKPGTDAIGDQVAAISGVQVIVGGSATVEGIGLSSLSGQVFRDNSVVGHIESVESTESGTNVELAFSGSSSVVVRGADSARLKAGGVNVPFKGSGPSGSNESSQQLLQFVASAGGRASLALSDWIMGATGAIELAGPATCS